MTPDRLDRLERKIDRLTWLVVGFIALVLGLAIPGLLGLALVVGLIIITGVGLLAFVRMFLPPVGYFLDGLAGRWRALRPPSGPDAA
jgi:hypothetical protein